MSPVSTRRRMPRTGSSVASSRTTSPCTRSGLTMLSVSRRAVIASVVAGSTSNSSCEANRAARSMRSGSSPKLTRGSIGVRRRPATRSSTPPVGSIRVRSGTRMAMAFTVKSRRTRSPSRLSPKATTGLRVVPS